MSSKKINEALKKILKEGEASNQEEIKKLLKSRGFAVTQATVSRGLARLNAQKQMGPDGNSVYVLPKAGQALTPIRAGTSIKDLVTSVVTNGQLIIVQTPPSSASIVARFLDINNLDGILGTLAGDDTIFIAPKDTEKTMQVFQAVKKVFGH